VDFVAERGICLIYTLDFVNFGGFRGFRLLAGPVLGGSPEVTTDHN